MSKDKPDTSKPILKSTLMFFNSKISDLNNKRLQLNRSKGLAKFLAKSQKNLRDLAPSLRAMESRRRGRVVPGSLRAGCFSAGKI